MAIDHRQIIATSWKIATEQLPPGRHLEFGSHPVVGIVICVLLAGIELYSKDLSSKCVWQSLQEFSFR